MGEKSFLLGHLFITGKSHNIFLIFFSIVFFSPDSLFLHISSLAALGLLFCMLAFSSFSKPGLLFIALCGLLTVGASLVAEHRLYVSRLQ